MLAAALTLPALPDRQDFSAETDRARLSKVALKAYRRLVEQWGLTGQQAAALLDVSTSTWERLKQDGKDKSLNQDQLTRISALVGIYKGLHLLFADDMADRWPKLGNKGPLFARMSPIESMIKGGIPQMLEVRRYVDAVRGGL
jgi:type II secretory pathway pseudopilin PulG